LVVAAQPLELQQLLIWIERRLQARGLKPTTEAVGLLAERVEGNLLAAAQEIEKLTLLIGDQELSAEAVMAAVGDSSRYSIYDWVDAALLGQPERVARILKGLRDEGVEPILVNWALHQEVRRLASLALAKRQGQTLESTSVWQKLWEKRKPFIRQALQRLTLAECQQLLRACVCADQTIKGIEPGWPWDVLLATGLRLSGLPLPLDQV
jgi:DNA polymerase-3 subunit delta